MRPTEAQLAGEEQLSGEQKDAIVREAAAQRADRCAKAKQIVASKKSAALGVKPKLTPKPSATSVSPSAKIPTRGAPVDGTTKGAPGGKAVSAAARKPTSGTVSKKPATGTAAKSSVAGAAAATKKPNAAAAAKKPATAKKPVAASRLSPEEEQASREAQLRAEEEERERQRELRWAEREAEREAVQAEIIAEERRVRAREQQQRAAAAALAKTQARLREAAFDGELDDVRRVVNGWVEECFGASLIGAKLDCADANGHTPLSEAACGGQLEVVQLLLDHGANVNSQNTQGRTPLWRAVFQDKREVVAALLARGADPTIAAEGAETPLMVAPTDGMRNLLREWLDNPERTQAAAAQRAAETEGQWVPPPPDPADAPMGEAGYFLQIGIQRLADALDAIGRDSDRYTLIVDLAERAATYLKYRDVNLAMVYKPGDCEVRQSCCVIGDASIGVRTSRPRHRNEPPSLGSPQVKTLRRLLLGALRYGKPFVLDFLTLELNESSLNELLEPIFPGLLPLLVSREVRNARHRSATPPADSG